MVNQLHDQRNGEDYKTAKEIWNVAKKTFSDNENNFESFEVKDEVRGRILRIKPIPLTKEVFL